MNNMLSLANIQAGGVLFSLSMLKPRCNSTSLRYDTWFEIAKELLSFMALYFTILNSTPSKSRIQLDSFEGSSTRFILLNNSTH